MNTSSIVATGLALASSTLALAGTASADPPPPNDNFARAQALRVADPSTDPCLFLGDGDNFDATRQIGERGVQDRRSQKTVWFKWTAPSGCGPLVTIDTMDSDFDTLLAVYNTNRLRQLRGHVVAENDDSHGTFQSSVTFAPVAGRTYRIQIDGFPYISGVSEGNVLVQATY